MAERRAASAAVARRGGFLVMPKGPAVASQADLTVPVAGGSITVRLYLPFGSRRPPLHVFLHGGGWCVGTLDEPAAGLDLGGREDLVARLGVIAADEAAPTTVLVTHHLEEIPVGFTHALLLREGAVVASGPIDTVLTDALVSQAFGLPITIGQGGGRWYARLRTDAS